MKHYNGFTPAQRNQSMAWLNSQWKAGTLAKPCKCIACGQDKGVIDAHAEDYSLPFEAGKTDEFHLCFRCHTMVHCRYKNKPAWDRYREAIMQGVRYLPFFGRNFPVFASQHLDAWRPMIETTGEPPARDVLGEIEHYGKKARLAGLKG